MSLADRLPLAALGLLALAWSATPLRPGLAARAAPTRVDASAPDRPLATLVPQQSLLYLEARGLDELLAAGLEHPLARALLASPLGAALIERSGRTPRAALDALDEVAGLEVLPTLARASAGGAALAVGLRPGRPAVLLLVRAREAAFLEATLDHALRRTAERAGYPGAFDRPTERIAGADVWRVGELVLARRGALALLANDADALGAALRLAADASARGLEGVEAFREARDRHDGSATLWGWIDLARARELQQRFGREQGLARLARLAAEPAAQLLLGPGASTLGRADSLAFGVTLRAEDVELHLAALGLDAGAAAALMPTPDGARGAPLASVGGGLAEAVLYRDLAGIFRERTALFAPELQPRFAEAESNLALLFGGADVAETILPHLGPWLTAVVRPVAFDPAATPDVPLPALALVARVDAPDEIGGDLVAAFQTAVGLINVDRAQKGLASLRLELSSVGAVTLTSARFGAPRPGEGVDLRYNLEPACALVGEAWVIGTHADLVRALALELQREPVSSAPADGERLRLSGPAVAELVAANRELLVMNGVLEEGKSRARAEQDVDGLRAAAELVEALELSVHYPASDEVRLEARLDLRPAGSAR